jgi:radical SAM superfamily enzyme YgiQ (UPF0313 family)
MISMKNNTIVLIEPNHARDVVETPTDLLYVAAALEHAGNKVCVIDANAERLKPDDICAKISGIHCGIVGISCQNISEKDLIFELCKDIKQNSNCKLILFGDSSAKEYALFLSLCRDIDYIITGQGEHIFPKMAQFVFSGGEVVQPVGVSCVVDGIPSIPQSSPLYNVLDELVIPSYHLVNMSLYDIYNVTVMRGCAHACYACDKNVTTRGKVFKRNPRLVMHEINVLYNKYGVKPVCFVNDSFVFDDDYFKKLEREMVFDSGFLYRYPYTRKSFNGVVI